jgi:hypothetical protein
MSRLQSNVPSGDLASKWTRHKFDMKLVNPANRRRFKIAVVGTGLAGASAAATLEERTLLRLRVGSTLPKTIRTMATLFTDSFTTPLRVATLERVKPTFTGSRKSR